LAAGNSPLAAGNSQLAAGNSPQHFFGEADLVI
jgi:hypothetical protein